MMRTPLPLAAFLSAAAALSVEIAIVRLGAPYVGQSLLPWSAAIVSVLLGLTAGHVLGGFAGGAAADRDALRRRLALAWAAGALSAAAMPLLVAGMEGRLSDEPGSGTFEVAAMAALAFPPSVAAGLVLPLLVRIAMATPGVEVPRTVGAIYAGSATGSVAGTAAAGFLLLEVWGSAGLAFAVALLWFALATAAVPWRRGRASRTVAAGGVAAAALAAIGLAGGRGPCLVESRYTCIRLLDRELAGGGLLRFMILDEGVHSASDRDRPERLHLGYAALADRLAQAALSRSGRPRALVIGGGGATLPRAWAAASPPVEVRVAELDGAVADMAARSMWAGGLPNLHTTVGDGRAMLRSLPVGAAFDVVLMDAYRTRSVPPHVVTREFDAEVAARLAESGVFLSNVIDRGDTLFLTLSIARTLSTVFPAVDVWIAEGEGNHATNVVLAAWKEAARAFRPDEIAVPVTVMEAGEAPRSRPVTWRRVDFRDAATRWPHACPVVLTDDRAPVDRLLAGRHACSGVKRSARSGPAAAEGER